LEESGVKTNGVVDSDMETTETINRDILRGNGQVRVISVFLEVESV